MAKGRIRCSPLLIQIFVTATICINILGHGCLMGYPAVLLPQLAEPDSIIQVDAERNSWLGSMMMLTVFVGNFLMPSLMDRLGRRTAHILVSLPMLAGWLIAAGAESFLMLSICRILHGLSFGLSLPLRSALIGEYTSPKYRGACLMFISFAQAGGIFVVHLIGTFLHWQTTALICVIFPFVSLIMTLYTPESPCYLASKGKFEECKEAFRWLRGDGEEAELEEMIAAQDIPDDEETSSWKELVGTLKKKEFYKPVLIMIHATASMQFSGGTTMSVYSTLIIGLILGPESNVYFWMIFLDTQRIISNLLAVYVITKYKRRTMLFSIGSVCIASHLAIAAYVFMRNNGYIQYDAVWIPILLINLHVFTVATGMVPLPNVIAGEVFPFEYRAIGGSINNTIATIFSFTLLKTFTGLTISIGIEGIYFIYSLFMIYFLVVIWFTLPETKGKTLQEIENEFRGIVRDSKEGQPLKETRKRKMSVISKHSVIVDF